MKEEKEEFIKKEIDLFPSLDRLNHPLFIYAIYLKYLNIDRIITTIKTLFNNDNYSEIKVEVILINLLYIFIKYSKAIRISFESTYQNNSMILSMFSYLKNKHEIYLKNSF